MNNGQGDKIRIESAYRRGYQQGWASATDARKRGRYFSI